MNSKQKIGQNQTKLDIFGNFILLTKIAQKVKMAYT